MSVLVLLIAAGGFVATGFLLAFLWAVRSGQFDDICTPAVRVLLDPHRLVALENDEPAARVIDSQPSPDIPKPPCP